MVRGAKGLAMADASRRQFLRSGAGAGALLSVPAFAQGSGRVVVIGGGFAGATCARFVKRLNAKLAVTLVETSRTFTACPFSNEVIVGLRDLKAQQFGYDKFAAGSGVTIAFATANAVDAQKRTVTLDNGTQLDYDRLIVAPGTDLRWDALPGYTETSAERMPHAWKAGPQTQLLRSQLEAMADGGTVLISAPANPFRCPPGPYERASLIAYYLKAKKPKSKIIVLDAKDAFSKQSLFQNAWKELYPNLEWVGLSKGGKVNSVDVGEMTLVTDFERYKGDVVNVIPPQKAGRIADLARVTNNTGWCPINPETFESTLQPYIHVIGDATIAGAMPKSAFTANAQAKVCAAAAVKLLAGEKPDEPLLINTCYSLVAPDYGISVANVYRPKDGVLVDAGGGVSPLNVSASFRAQEAAFANGWFRTITAEVFG